MKLSRVYELPGEHLPLNKHTFCADWFPEIPGLAERVTDDTFERMTRSGMLAIKRHAYREFDNTRFVRLSTLWWEGTGIAVFQDQRLGVHVLRSKRFVTSDWRMDRVLNYLRGLVDGLTRKEDVCDPNTDFWADELLELGGVDFGNELGVGYHPRSDKLALITAHNEALSPETCEVAAKPGVTAPRFVRVGGWHYELADTAPEVLAPAAQALGYDRSFKYKGIPRPRTSEPIVRL